MDVILLCHFYEILTGQPKRPCGPVGRKRVTTSMVQLHPATFFICHPPPCPTFPVHSSPAKAEPADQMTKTISHSLLFSVKVFSFLTLTSHQAPSWIVICGKHTPKALYSSQILAAFITTRFRQPIELLH